MKELLGRMKSVMYNYFTNVHYSRTERQLETSRWLIRKMVPFSRWCLLPAAVLIQTCLGSLQAWSGFNLPIEEKIYGPNGGIDQAIVVNVLYVAVVSLAISAAVFGPWLDRNGPLKGTLLGASLFYGGNLLTALGVYTKQMPLVFVGYGVFAGAGIGISTIAPVSCLQKWFPDYRGLASAFSVCGVGIGSVIAPFAQDALMGIDYGKAKAESPHVELTFVILGTCYFAAMTVSALVLRMPPPGYQVKGIAFHTVKGAETNLEVSNCQTDDSVDLSTHFSMTVKECISSTRYWMTYVMFIGVVLGGLMVISKIQPIIQNQLGKPLSEAVMINALLGAVNLLGRLTVPIFSDWIDSRRILFSVSLICQASCLECLPLALNSQSYTGVMVCAFIISFFYGAGFGLIPAFLADQFGANNVGITNGLIMTAWAIAAAGGGALFTSVYNSEKMTHASNILKWYDVDFHWMLAPVLFSFLLSLFIPCGLRDRTLPRVAGEMFRFRLLNLPLVRLVGWRLQIVTDAQERAEWKAYLSSLTPTKICVQETSL